MGKIDDIITHLCYEYDSAVDTLCDSIGHTFDGSNEIGDFDTVYESRERSMFELNTINIFIDFWYGIKYAK